jgi:hypothetical protein
MYYRDSTDEDEEIDKAKEVTGTSREQAVEVRDKILPRRGGEGGRKARCVSGYLKMIICVYIHV